MAGNNTVGAMLLASQLIPGSFTVRIPVYYQETYTIYVFDSSTSSTIRASIVVNFSSGLPTITPLPVLSRSISGLTPGKVYFVRILQSNLASGQTPFEGYVKLASQLAIPTITSVSPSDTTSGAIRVSFPKHPQDLGSFKYKLQAFAVSSRNGQTVISQTAAHTGTDIAFSADPNSSLMTLSTASLTPGSLYQIRLVVTDSTSQVVWNTAASSNLPAGATGTLDQSSLITPFISNYTNNPSNTTAPYQITFSSTPLPLVTLPYATNTSASTSVTITSFPAATVAATGQQYIVYALDTDTSVTQPSLDDLKKAQNGIFSVSFTQAVYNALPKSAPTTASTNVTVQGLVVTKNYKFAVIALSSVGYIVGGFVDATTTLSGIRASAQAEYVSSSFASGNFTLTYKFEDDINTYTTVPIIRVTATREGDTPLTVSSSSTLLIDTSSPQNLSFVFPIASSSMTGHLLEGTIYNFVASVSGGRIGETTTGGSKTGGSSVIGSVSVSTSLLTPCPHLPPTLTVQNSSTPGSIDFTIADATPGLETTVNYTLYFGTTSSSTNPTTLPQTTLKRGMTNTIAISALTGIVAGTNYFFFVKYTGGSANTYSTTAPLSVASSSSFLVPVALPAVSNISFSDPTVVNAISVGFTSDLTGRLAADDSAITLANNNYTKFTSTNLSQASPVPWLSKDNLPYLSSQLQVTSLDTKTPAISVSDLNEHQTQALQVASSVLVDNFISAAKTQLLANLEAFTAFQELDNRNEELKTSTSSSNTDETGKYLLNKMVDGFVIDLVPGDGVITNNQPFYKTPSQIMASLETANSTPSANSFKGMNSTIYQALLSRQAGTSPFSDSITMLDFVKEQLVGTGAPLFNVPLANYALVKSAVSALQLSVANAAVSVTNFGIASNALSTALNGATLTVANFQKSVEIKSLMTIMYNVAITSTPYPQTTNWFLTPELPSLSTIVSAVNTAYGTAANNLVSTYQVQLSTAFADPQVAPIITVPISNISPVYSTQAAADSTLLRRTGISGFNAINHATSLVAGNTYFARVTRIIPSGGFVGAYVPSGGNALVSTQKAVPAIQVAAPTNVSIQPSSSIQGSITVNYVAAVSAGSNAQYTVTLRNQTTTPNQTSTYLSSSSASCVINGLVPGNTYVATVSTNGTPGVYSGSLVVPRIASSPSSASAAVMAPMQVPAPIALVAATADPTTGIRAYTYNPFLSSASTPYQISIVFNPNWTSVPRQSDLQNQSYSATFTGLINPTTTSAPVVSFSKSQCTELLGGNLQWTYTIPSTWFVNGSNTRTLSSINVVAIHRSALNYLQNSNSLTITANNPPFTVPSASSISVTSLEIISGIVNFDFSVPSSMVAADSAFYPVDNYHPRNAGTNALWSGPQSFTLSLLNQTAPSAAPLVFNTAQTIVTQGATGTAPTVSTRSFIDKSLVGDISYFSGSFPSTTPLLGGNSYILQVELDESYGNLAPASSTILSSMPITGIAQLLAPTGVVVENIPGKAGAISVSWQIPSTSYNYQILVSSQNGDFQKSFSSLVPGENGLLPIASGSTTYKYDIFLYGDMATASPPVVINGDNPLSIQIINMPVLQSDIQSNPTIVTNIVPLLLLSQATSITKSYDDATPSLTFNPPAEADGILSLSYKVIVRDTANLSTVFSSVFNSNNGTASPITVYILSPDGRGLLQRNQSYECTVISNYSGNDSPSGVVANSSFTSSSSSFSLIYSLSAENLSITQEMDTPAEIKSGSNTYTLPSRSGTIALLTDPPKINEINLINSNNIVSTAGIYLINATSNAQVVEVTNVPEGGVLQFMEVSSTGYKIKNNNKTFVVSASSLVYGFKRAGNELILSGKSLDIISGATI